MLQQQQVLLHDIRGPSIKRLSIAGPLYALALSGGNCNDELRYLAVGGMESQLTVFESRRWGVAGRWASACKHDIVANCFSPIDPKKCFVVGIDAEVVCGDWSVANQHSFSRPALRSNARWCGIDVLGNTLFALNENRMLHRVENALALCPEPPKKPEHGKHAKHARKTDAQDAEENVEENSDKRKLEVEALEVKRQRSEELE